MDTVKIRRRLEDQLRKAKDDVQRLTNDLAVLDRLERGETKARPPTRARKAPAPVTPPRHVPILRTVTGRGPIAASVSGAAIEIAERDPARSWTRKEMCDEIRRTKIATATRANVNASMDRLTEQGRLEIASIGSRGERGLKSYRLAKASKTGS